MIIIVLFLVFAAGHMHDAYEGSRRWNSSDEETRILVARLV